MTSHMSIANGDRRRGRCQPVRDGTSGRDGSAAGRGAYPGGVSSYPPDGPAEQQWQQPPFASDGPPRDATPASGHVVVPGTPGPLPAPSSFEVLIGTLAKLVWPVAILLIVFTKATFWPVLITAIVAGTILGALKRNLKQRRREIAAHHPRPPLPGPPPR